MTSMIPDAGKLLYTIHVRNVLATGDYALSVKNWGSLDATARACCQKTAEDLHKHWFQPQEAIKRT